MWKNDLIRKIRLILNFKTSQPRKQTIAKHILPNIARCKCNQATKFDQLEEYTMENIFHEKSCTKCGGETFARLFFKKSKLSISLDQWSKI